MRPNNIIVIPSTEDTFFKHWVTVIAPFIGTAAKEGEVLAEWLKLRHELSTSITDPELLDSVVMSMEMRKKVADRSGITTNYLNVLVDSYKKKGIVVDGKFLPKIVPNIEGDGSFNLMITFKR